MGLLHPPIMVLYTPRSGDWGRRRRPKAVNGAPHDLETATCRPSDPPRGPRGLPRRPKGLPLGRLMGLFPPKRAPKRLPRTSDRPPTTNAADPATAWLPHEPHEGEMAPRFGRKEAAGLNKISND